MFLLLSIISFLPIVLLGIYIYKKDSVKEPKSLLMGLFASGFLAAILVVIVNLLLILIMPHLYLSGDYSQFSFFELFILVFLEVALVEEFMKWIMIRFIGYPHKDFDQIYDIIVYAVFVALGFAAIENFFYVIEGGITLGIYNADNVDVGFYTLALTVATPLSMLPSIIGTTYFKRFAVSNQISNKIMLGTIILTIVSCVVFVMIINPVVRILYDESYSPVAYYASFLAIGTSIHGLGDMVNRFLGAHGQGKYLRNGAFMSGAILLIGSFGFVFLWGIGGAILSRILSSVVFCGSMIYYYIQFTQKMKAI